VRDPNVPRPDTAKEAKVPRLTAPVTVREAKVASPDVVSVAKEANPDAVTAANVAAPVTPKAPRNVDTLVVICMVSTPATENAKAGVDPSRHMPVVELDVKATPG